MYKVAKEFRQDKEYTCAGCRRSGIYYNFSGANLCKKCGQIIIKVEHHIERRELTFCLLLIFCNPKNSKKLMKTGFGLTEEPGMIEQMHAISKGWGMRTTYEPGDDL